LTYKLCQIAEQLVIGCISLLLLPFFPAVVALFSYGVASVAVVYVASVVVAAAVAAIVNAVSHVAAIGIEVVSVAVGNVTIFSVAVWLMLRGSCSIKKALNILKPSILILHK